MKCYSATKNTVSPDICCNMEPDLGKLMLSEASHKGPRFVRSYLCEISRIVKSVETDSRQSTGCQGLGGRNREATAQWVLGF